MWKESELGRSIESEMLRRLREGLKGLREEERELVGIWAADQIGNLMRSSLAISDQIHILRMKLAKTRKVPMDNEEFLKWVNSSFVLADTPENPYNRFSILDDLAKGIGQQYSVQWTQISGDRPVQIPKKKKKDG